MTAPVSTARVVQVSPVSPRPVTKPQAADATRETANPSKYTRSGRPRRATTVRIDPPRPLHPSGSAQTIGDDEAACRWSLTSRFLRWSWCRFEPVVSGRQQFGAPCPGQRPSSRVNQEFPDPGRAAAGGQLQRSDRGTPASACSTWLPQPAQVALPHVRHVIRRHIVWFLRSRVRPVALLELSASRTLMYVHPYIQEG